MPLEGEEKAKANRRLYLQTLCEKRDLEGFQEPGEILGNRQLYDIFYGKAPIHDSDEDEDEGAKKKKKTKKIERLNPSKSKQGYTYEGWLALRRAHRSDLWLLADTLTKIQGRWYEKVHRPLMDFFVHKDNTSLPQNYTQDDLNDCLFKQDVQHERLLLYPRGTRKSTADNIDSVQWIINFPDIEILVVTATRELGLKFVQDTKKYFAIRDYKRPTEFQLLFPEFCYEDGTGDSRKYRCPIAHLGLKDPTLSYSSMESGVAGGRCHVLKFDDAVDEQNYRTPESRLAVIAKFHATKELVIKPYGFIDVIGTRWTDGDPSDTAHGPIPDLYGDMLRVNNESDEQDLRILKGAAWTVLPSGIEKTIRDLKIEDVDLLFPEQQSFKVLRKELLEDEALFRSNKLNEPAMIQAKDVFINNFTDTLLSKVIVHHSLVPPRGMNRVYIFWDTALTAGRQSDYSAGIVFMIQDIPGKDPIAWVLEIKYDHWTSSELVYQIVALSKKWAPDCTFIETLPSTTNTFKESVRTQKIMQGTSDFMISWFKPDPAAKAKETRIKFLEILMTRGILKIVMGTWIDEMKKQLLGYTGHKSNKNYKSGRKDDIPDAMGCVHQVLPFLSTLFPKTEEEKKLDEALIARKGMLDQYRWIYGSDPIDLGGPTIKHPEGRGSDRELHSGQDINVRHPSDIQMPPSNIGPPGSYVIEEDEGMQRGAYGIPLVPKYNK